MAKKRVQMPSITLLVARSYPDNVIGIENRLPWRLGTDLRLFKKRTKDHSVVMGNKTFKSIGKPLPNRTNVVLSRSPVDEYGSVVWAKNVEDALFRSDVDTICRFQKEFFVIGGEQIYKAFELYINKVYLTEVFCGNINGDAKFEQEFDVTGTDSEWKFHGEQEYPKSEIDEYPFRITCFRRRVQRHRYRVETEFMGRDEDVRPKLSQYELVLDRPEEQEQFELVL